MKVLTKGGLLLCLPLMAACPRTLPSLADGDVQTTDGDAAPGAPAPPSSLTLVDPKSPVANDSTPTVRVGGVTAGHTVSLFSSAACGGVALQGSATASGPTVEITTAALQPGVTTLHASARSPGGQSSSCSVASLAYEYVYPVGVALGLAHGCVVLSSGRVACSGANGSGQLGDGTTVDRLVPVYVSGITNAAAVTCGMEHSCALLADHTVRCWGQGRWGQLGNGSTDSSSTPVPVKGITTATAIGARAATDWLGSHTCALLANGTVWCWGSNADGALGNNSTSDSATPVQASGLTGVQTLGVGASHSCAVKASGAAYCWGDNGSGQLGDSSTTGRLVPWAVAGGISTFVRVDAGAAISCGVLGDQSARCWGEGTWGGSGLGTWDDKLVPTAVPSLAGVVEVVPAQYGACARLASGAIRCTGMNFAGQIPGLDGTDESAFTPVVGVTGATALAMAEHTSCAINGDRFLQCWGGNTMGQYGDGSRWNSAAPKPVSSLSDVRSISTNLWGSCAVRLDGKGLCWGFNKWGALGTTATSPPTVAAPSPISGSLNLVQVSTGLGHSCAVTSGASGGKVYCWGAGWDGKLGDGTKKSSSVPVAAAGIGGGSPKALQVSVGMVHSCAVLDDKTVRCWGDNPEGQLGTGDNVASGTPVAVPGLTDAVQVEAGSRHTCARLGAGSVRCWGSGSYGQLGNSSTGSTTPVSPSGLSDVSSIGMGAEHSCAVVAGGAVRCWGAGSSGQIGDGGGSNRGVPTTVSGITNAVEVRGSQRNTCARISDGTVRCWGQGLYGANGDGTSVARSTLVTVQGLSDAIALAGGGSGYTFFAIRGDNSVVAWGYNGAANFGDSPPLGIQTMPGVPP